MFLWLKVWRLSQRLGEDNRIGEEAVSSLTKIGSAAVPRLMKALKSSTHRTRANAALALGQIGDPRAVEVLVARLEDYPPYVAMSVARALSLIGDKRAVSPLIVALRNKSNIRGTIIRVLGELRDSLAVDALVGLLDDEQYEIRDSAAEALAQIGDTRAVNHLLKSLECHPSKAVVAALGTFNWQPTKVPHRVLYAIALCRASDASIEGEAAVPILIPLLKADRQEIREAAADAIGNIGDTRAFEPLMQAFLADSLPNSYAALGKLGDRRALKFLLDSLNRGDSYKNEQAIQGLGYLGEPEAVGVLLEILSGKIHLITVNRSPKEYAAEALERILIKSAKGIATTELRQLAHVENPELVKYVMADALDDYYSKKTSRDLDCSQLRRLAIEELIHRGQKVDLN